MKFCISNGRNIFVFCNQCGDDIIITIEYQESQLLDRDVVDNFYFPSGIEPKSQIYNPDTFGLPIEV